MRMRGKVVVGVGMLVSGGEISPNQRRLTRLLYFQYE